MLTFATIIFYSFLGFHFLIGRIGSVWPYWGLPVVGRICVRGPTLLGGATRFDTLRLYRATRKLVALGVIEAWPEVQNRPGTQPTAALIVCTSRQRDRERSLFRLSLGFELRHLTTHPFWFVLE